MRQLAAITADQHHNMMRSRGSAHCFACYDTSQVLYQFCVVSAALQAVLYSLMHLEIGMDLLEAAR